MTRPVSWTVEPIWGNMAGWVIMRIQHQSSAGIDEGKTVIKWQRFKKHEKN
jgi:hypothetical protein